MIREFYSKYPFAVKDGIAQAFAIDFLVYKHPEPPTRWTELTDIKDEWMRVMILSQAIATSNKDQARVGMRRDPGGYSYWLKNRSPAFLQKRLKEMKSMDLIISSPIIPSISSFPHGSWSIHLSFTLLKPYISRDDTDFYIIDNPVKKEWVFKVPYIAPSQWKGALRSTMVKELIAKLSDGQVDKDRIAKEFDKERLRLWRLFGNEKDGTSEFLSRSLARYLMGEIPEDEQGKQDWEKNFIFKTKEVEKDFEKRIKGECYRKGDIEGFQGSLHFYPTYFDRMGLEVINPHDREGGAGMNPIYFECVPAITRDKDGKEVHTGGTFTLLYVPIVGPEVSEEGAKKDLEAVARGIGAMMTHYGFGAKTSSGFGVAKVEPDKANVEPLDFKQAWLDGWKTEG